MMADQAQEPIASRFIRLNQLIYGKSNHTIPNRHLIHRDGLLDALFAIYEECSNEYMRKDKHVAAFVDKMRPIMSELKRMRVNLRDFEVKKIIGRGHFGEVQVVREKVSGDVYAMKVLQKVETLSQQSVAFYEEERDIMAKASSAWLTKLQYAFQDSNNLYLIMEFHPGGDMLSLLEKHDNVLPDDMAKFYIAELILAIQSVHAMGYVHRDIKPDNILIDRTGHIKLADFGSSAKYNSQKLVTSKMPVGTPDYIAPEVLIAMNCVPSSMKTYGTGCDWWSLGVVSYEMLFGVTPFHAETVLIVYNNIMNHKKSLKFPEGVSDVPEEFIDLIKNLLLDAVERVGYDDLINHKLFIDVDWNSIRQTVPPYVPTVIGQDDTSNFDDFEPEVRPSVMDLNGKKEFTGKNFPFIGFTYTSPFESLSERLSTSFDNSFSSPVATSSDKELLSKKKEVSELQFKISEIRTSEADLKNQLEKLNKLLKYKDKKLSIFENEQNRLEGVINDMQSEIKHLRRLLNFERKERLLSSQKAVEMINCMKNYKKNESFLKKNISDEQKRQDQEKTIVEEQLQNVLSKIEVRDKEAENINQELENTKALLARQEKMTLDAKRGISELKQNMQTQIDEYDGKIMVLQEKLISTEIKNQNLNDLVKDINERNANAKQELLRTEKEKYIAECNVENLKSIICRLEEDLQNATNSGCGESCDKQNANVITRIENELKDKQNKINDLQEQVMKEQEKCANLNDKLQEADNELLMTSTMKGNLGKQIRLLEKKEYDLSQQLKQLQDSIQLYEEKLGKVEKKCASCEKRQSIATEIIENQAKRAIAEVSSDLNQQNQYLSTKFGHLESENLTLKEEIKEQEVKYSEVNDQNKNLEKELSEVKLDLRLLTREKGEEEKKVSMLRDNNRNLREKVNNAENVISQKESVEAELKGKIRDLEVHITESNNDLNEKNKLFEVERAKLRERVKAMQDVCESTKDLNQKFAKSQGQYEEICKQNDNLKSLLKDKDDERSQVMEELQKLKRNIAVSKQECAKTEQTNKALKLACTMMEDEIKDYEFLLDTHLQSLEITKIEKNSLKDAKEKLEQDLKHVNSCLIREKDARLALEEQVQSLSEELENQQMLHNNEVLTLKDQLVQQKATVEDLEEQLAELEKNICIHDHNEKVSKRQASSLEEEVIKIKEEAARYITQISSLKSSNLKLTQGLEELIEKQKNAQETIDRLYNDMETAEVGNNHEKLKLQETISQQTKLIDFLQSKTEGMERKKKYYGVPFLFGKKDCNTSPAPLQWRDMEALLEKERSRNRRMQDQLSQAQAESIALRNQLNQASSKASSFANIPVSPTSRAMHSALTLSPSSSGDVDSPIIAIKNGNAIRSSRQIERMKHKIPHRFMDVICMRGIKCAACLDSIHFGRPATKCEECEVFCHSKCATSLPNTCGLPSEFVKHYVSTIHHHHPSLEVTSSDQESEPEGWVKIPKNNKPGWEQRYMRLIGTTVYFFENTEDIEPPKAFDNVDFAVSNGSVCVTSAVSASELPGAAKSDRPYIFKIELHPNTTCWPPRCLYIMTQSFMDKKLWVSTLEAVAAQQNLLNGTQEKRLLGHPVLKLKGEKYIDINCISSLNDKVILVGAMEGLFVVTIRDFLSGSLKCQVDGVGSVYQIVCVTEINMILLIAGDHRCLSAIDMNDIEQWASDSPSLPQVALKPIPKSTACHLFSVEDISFGAPHLCAANSETVIVYQWNVKGYEFCEKKIMETKEPCSCIHFTENSIIFGADKFYEIDLMTYTIEEFLDSSDTSLACLVYGVSHFRSFPIAIFQISREPEYLLCFHELGVFVDGFGQRTRQDDLKWSRLPLAFAFRSPYLFVTHFNSLEVDEILTCGSTEKGVHSILAVPNPRYLGPALDNGSIFLASIHDEVVEVISVNGNLGRSRHSSSSSKENTDENDFSFSTSLIQSLDALPVDDLSLSTETSEPASVNSS